MSQHGRSPRTASPLRRSTAALARLAGAAVDLLMPMRCVACGREGAYVCERCEPRLPRLEPPFCAICASPGESPHCGWCVEMPPAVDSIRAPYLMEGPVRQMVYDLKYRDIRAAAPALARLMAAGLAAGALDVVTPVPLHPRRQRERGYNQSELLARELGRATGLTVVPSALQRVRDTPPQVSLGSEAERRASMSQAFHSPGGLEGARVLLVDDVVTTGATMSAAAVALKDAGARSVRALALARQS